MAADIIPQLKKTYNHKIERVRGARKLAGYGEHKNRYKVYRLKEKQSKSLIATIRKDYG